MIKPFEPCVDIGNLVSFEVIVRSLKGHVIPCTLLWCNIVCWYLGFLNSDDDDDEEAEAAADDYVPDADVARITENIGWSSRTRCATCLSFPVILLF